MKLLIVIGIVIGIAMPMVVVARPPTPAPDKEDRSLFNIQESWKTLMKTMEGKFTEVNRTMTQQFEEVKKWMENTAEKAAKQSEVAINTIKEQSREATKAMENMLVPVFTVFFLLCLVCVVVANWQAVWMCCRCVALCCSGSGSREPQIRIAAPAPAPASAPAAR